MAIARNKDIPKCKKHVEDHYNYNKMLIDYYNYCSEKKRVI